MNQFAKWFAGFRATRGFPTQESLADATGISESTIKSIEFGSGFSQRHANTKSTLAKALKVPSGLLEEIEGMLDHGGTVASAEAMIREHDERTRPRNDRVVTIPDGIDVSALAFSFREIARQLEQISSRRVNEGDDDIAGRINPDAGPDEDAGGSGTRVPKPRPKPPQIPGVTKGSDPNISRTAASQSDAARKAAERKGKPPKNGEHS